MNLQKLKELEEDFFEYYPNGFEDEELLKIRKKFKSEKFTQEVQELFKKENFSQPVIICDNFSKIVSKSPLISLFEKPKLKDAIKSMGIYQKDMLSIALYEMLYGDFKDGFEDLVEILASYNLAKWSLVTLIPYYFSRKEHFFIKPTTTKEIIKYLEITNVTYKPTPTYEFYEAYKKILDELKANVDESLGFDNAGFTGFFKITISRCEN